MTLYPPPPPLEERRVEADAGDGQASPPSVEAIPFTPPAPDSGAAQPARSQWGRAPHRASTRRPQPIREPETPKEKEPDGGPATMGLPPEPPPIESSPDFPEGA